MTMRPPYIPNQNVFRDHYVAQAEQRGGTLPVFRGARRQRGHGLGNVFGSIYRWLKPMVQNTASAAGRELLKTGVGIASDTLAGKTLKQAASERLQETAQRGVDTIQQQQQRVTKKKTTAQKRPSAAKTKSAPPKKKRQKPVPKDLDNNVFV